MPAPFERLFENATPLILPQIDAQVLPWRQPDMVRSVGESTAEITDPPSGFRLFDSELALVPSFDMQPFPAAPEEPTADAGFFMAVILTTGTLILALDDNNNPSAWDYNWGAAKIDADGFTLILDTAVDALNAGNLNPGVTTRARNLIEQMNILQSFQVLHGHPVTHADGTKIQIEQMPDLTPVVMHKVKRTDGTLAVYFSEPNNVKPINCPPPPSIGTPVAQL